MAVAFDIPVSYWLHVAVAGCFWFVLGQSESQFLTTCQRSVSRERLLVERGSGNPW
jgi:hypothetical protein